MRALRIVFVLGMFVVALPSQAARSKKSDPAAARGHREKAMQLNAAGNTADAATEFLAAISADNNDGVSHAELGKIYFAQKRYAEAIPEFDAAVRIDSKDPLNAYNLAFAYKKSERFKDAQAAYQKYIALNPTDPDGYYGLADSLRLGGDNTAALPAFETYIAKAAGHDDQAKSVERAKQRIEEIKKTDTAALAAAQQAEEEAANIQRAKEAQAKKAAEAAEQAKRDQVARDQAARAAAEKLLTDQVSVQATKAQAAHDQALQAPPAPPPEVAAPAPAPAVVSAAPPAATPVAPALVVASPPPPSSPLVGPAPIVHAPASAIHEQPATRAKLAEGDGFFAAKDYRRALFAYQDAERLDTGSVEALYKCGLTYATLGYYQEAVDRWEKVLTIDPVNAGAKDNIARARRHMNAPNAPVADIAGSDDAGARTHYAKGVELINGQHYNESLPYLDEAIRLKPSYAVAYIARGSAHVGLGQFTEAVTDYRASLGIDASMASPLFGIAEAYRGMGDNGHAVEFYRRYASSTGSDVREDLRVHAQKIADQLVGQ